LDAGIDINVDGCGIVWNSGESRVNGDRANFDCDEGIEPTYGSFEWCQIRILVREDSEIPRFYS